MNTDLVIVFKVVLTLYVVVALKLKQPPIFYCTAIISQISVLGSICNVDDYTWVKTLLFGDQNHSQEENLYIINATV